MDNQLLASLYVRRLSRDRVNFNGKQEWTGFVFFEKAFLNKHKDLTESYREYMKSEKKYWRDLFTPLFKEHSLLTFVAANVEFNEDTQY